MNRPKSYARLQKEAEEARAQRVAAKYLPSEDDREVFSALKARLNGGLPRTNREFEDAAPLPADLDLRTANVELYEFFLSPPCWKVRALLHYYKVSYDSVFCVPFMPRKGLDNRRALDTCHTDSRPAPHR